ncbi:T9SS type B sorting domain-containing protein, partial [Tenacibaculum agarivorans]|uniref:T9SS type B sorting domain-containing protein n=1 Tax=Tenacibaculum agarivorans TaxID=1908389 RepID=UPI000AF8E92F
TVQDNDGNTSNVATISVTVISAIPDTEDDVVTIEEDEEVQVDIFDNDTSIPNTGTLTVSDPTNGTITVDDNGTPDDPSDDVVTYTPLPDFVGEDSFTYTVCNNATPPDCSTSTVTITVEGEDITIFNEFSPNGDGRNDFLFIDDIENYPGNTVEIFNRWGNTVYKIQGYNNSDASRRFEGISNGRVTVQVDDQLPVGTYFYVIDLGDGSPVKQGWIYINR